MWDTQLKQRLNIQNYVIYMQCFYLVKILIRIWSITLCFYVLFSFNFSFFFTKPISYFPLTVNQIVNFHAVFWYIILWSRHPTINKKWNLIGLFKVNFLNITHTAGIFFFLTCCFRGTHFLIYSRSNLFFIYICC